ncbi:MAG TPA: lipid A deacylase LpxR family protein [Gammaproteobacteria bacterium]|nr:lipid A deacylase LpxR family protein [Gammaproteobacteria bacterium]
MRLKKYRLKNRLSSFITRGLRLAIILTLLPALAEAVTPSSSRYPSPRQVDLASFIENEKRPQQQALDIFGKEKAKSAWAFYFDNDFLSPTSQDRDYTGGFSITLSGANARKHPLSIDRFLVDTNRWLGISSTTDITLHSIEFGATAFTPEDTLATASLDHDRPYASLIYLSNSNQSISADRTHSTMTTLTMGLLGLDVIKSFQKSLHQATGSDPANGWDHQISAGGEPTFRFGLSRQKLNHSGHSKSGRGYEIHTALKASLGYLTSLSWGISSRWGKIKTPWWTFNPEASEYAEKSAPLSISSVPYHGREFYFWAGANVHLRLYNAFLQGQFRDSDVTYAYHELHPVVVEGWMGFTRELHHGYRFSYVLRGQTAEINHGPASRSSLWGGVIFSRAF